MAISPEAWNAARARVLTRNADAAAGAAAAFRERVSLFPGHADELERRAAELDRYAAQCRAAATDPSLPNPEYAGTGKEG